MLTPQLGIFSYKSFARTARQSRLEIARRAALGLQTGAAKNRYSPVGSLPCYDIFIEPLNAHPTDRDVKSAERSENPSNLRRFVDLRRRRGRFLGSTLLLRQRTSKLGNRPTRKLRRRCRRVLATYRAWPTGSTFLEQRSNRIDIGGMVNADVNQRGILTSLVAQADKFDLERDYFFTERSLAASLALLYSKSPRGFLLFLESS